MKIVVFNNGDAGLRRAGDEGQRASSTPACDLKNPNFAAMAEAMGIKGVRVEQPEDLEGALAEALGA